MHPLIILSAPSSCGKNVIADALLKQFPGLERVITATTRAPRSEEHNGRDYYFWTLQEFQDHVAQGDMLEWAHVHNLMVGIPRISLEKIVQAHKVPLLVIDVQGAKTIKQQWPGAVSIFVKPENLKVMRAWLVARGRNTPQEIEIRLKSAEQELAEVPTYDHVIVNRDGKLQETISEVARIVQGIMHETI